MSESEMTWLGFFVVLVALLVLARLCPGEDRPRDPGDTEYENKWW